MDNERSITLHVMKDGVKEPIQVNLKHIKKIDRLPENRVRIYLILNPDEWQTWIDITENHIEIDNIIKLPT